MTPIDADAGPGLVLLGGSFDPPHRGHVELAVMARDAAAPGATLVFVPAARSPHKSHGPVAGDADRVEMLRLAIEGADNARVWSDEIDRGGASYWIQTLECAREAAGEVATIRFVIGADQALAFHRWRQPRRILELAQPIVILRAPIGTPEDFARVMNETDAWEDDELAAWRGWCVELPLHGASSTLVRTALRAGDDTTAQRLLAPGVWSYIQERGLYQEG